MEILPVGDHHHGICRGIEQRNRVAQAAGVGPKIIAGAIGDIFAAGAQKRIKIIVANAAVAVVAVILHYFRKTRGIAPANSLSAIGRGVVGNKYLECEIGLLLQD